MHAWFLYHFLDRLILLGNHRDAWVFGGIDPSSGTACMLEIGKALGMKYKQGMPWTLVNLPNSFFVKIISLIYPVFIVTCICECLLCSDLSNRRCSKKKPLIYLVSVYSTEANGAKQTSETLFKLSLRLPRIPTCRKQTSWLFANMAEDLN